MSELGLVTQSGKVVWGKCSVKLRVFYYVPSRSTGKYAQVTNNPENDGCINAVLLV